MLADVMPDEEFIKLFNYFRRRNAKYTNLSTPLEYKDYNMKNKKEIQNMDSKHSKL